MPRNRANIHDLETMHWRSLKTRLCQEHDHELSVSNEVGVHHHLHLIQFQLINALTHRNRRIIYQDVHLAESL